MEPRTKILLVDDQPANLLALGAILRDLGEDLVEARSGEEALRHLLHADFAAVLLDIKMEGLDGFETARVIRGRERCRDTPIIFLTAFDTAAFSAEKAYALGAVDYLVKPIVPVILRAKVAGFVDLYNKTERLRHLERAAYERRLAEERHLWQLQRLREEADRERKNAEALAELDRRKDEFLALLGHELRNPLAPIRNAVAALGRADLGAAEQARGIIDRQSRLLARLVDDLLDVSRIRHGKITLHRERVDLAAAVAAAVETCRPLLEARGHDLVVALPPGPVCLDADPARLAQVVVNLLTNAAKYTPPGGHVWLAAQAERACVVLRVRDTGVGIAADMLGRVFEPFAQLDRSPSSAWQWGLGVGLSLVKALVEMHGGSVTATSPGPGRGAEFIVRLPLAAGEAVAARPAATEASRAAVRPLRVLVVDDNQAQVESLAVLLGLDGHEVRTAADGPRALEEAAAFRPQAVLLDIGLPGMDGYEVARRLRQQPRPERMLLVALTGYGSAEDVGHARAAGFDHHLVKPAEPAEVRRLLAAGAAGGRV
jgi:signal transduction histidine kinase